MSSSLNTSRAPSLAGSQPPSSKASPLRSRLAQPHAFAASLNTAGRPPPKAAECPTHFYQLDLSTLRRGSAVFGTEKTTARSEGDASAPGSARSTGRAASEGATPRLLLGPDFDAPLRKHTFAASLKTSGRTGFTDAGCPVHSYSGQGAPHDRSMATFGRARTGRGLLVPLEGGAAALLGPDYDLPLRRKTASCTFGGAPRPDGPLALTRSGLAPVPPASAAPPPASAPRTSMYLKRKSENQAKALTPAPPPPPRAGKRLAPVRPLEADPAAGRAIADAAAIGAAELPNKLRPPRPLLLSPGRPLGLAAALPSPVACAA